MGMKKVIKTLKKEIFLMQILLVLVAAAFLGLVSYKWFMGKDTISSIAYNNFKEKDDYRVYVKEDGNYVPFLVIANEYVPGSTLLLRESILSELRRVNEYNSYYKDSEIDRLLNGEYYNKLKEIHHLIKNTPIEIYSKEAIGFSGDETEYINRHIFLLSNKELAFEYENEGKELEYFYKPENRISYYNGETTSWVRKGEATSWLLRTPVRAYFSAVFSATYEGALCIGNAFSLYGIRPAFCVDSSTKIKKKEGIVYGEKVYVLE